MEPDDSCVVKEKDCEQTPEVKPKRSPLSFLGKLLRDFFLGCVAFIPLSLLIFIVYFFFNLFFSIGRVLFGLTDSLSTSVALSTLILVILMYTGMKLRRKERWLLNFIEQAITRVPVMGGWYETFRDIVQTFTAGGGDKGYLGTVAVPVGAGYIIGFVTKRELDIEGNARVTVFVPTSPNPTTGLVFFYPEDKIEYIDMTPEQAFTKVISLGMKS